MGASANAPRTASTYDPSAMTAAHRTLPFDTLVRVTHCTNGCSAVVRINDRGPFKKGRLIDLSKAAAQQLRMIEAGVGPVEIAVIGSADE
jgi:rare lipoprotein A